MAGTGYDVDAFARDTAAFTAETGKPVVVAAPQPGVAARFKAHGAAVFTGEAEAINALAQVIGHHDLMARTAAADVRADDARPALRQPPAAGPQVMLNEADSLARLAEAGVPVIPHRLCATPEEATAALAELGGPVAVKGCSRDVAHKSELGLVHLGLATPEAVDTAFRACREAITKAGASFDGAIVSRMAKGRREMLLGAHRDPVFGPVVVIGDGGKYVEALPDVALLLPPFDRTQVRAALGRLRIAPILAGVRGEPPVNLDAYCDAACAVGALMVADPRIASLDINPLMVGDGADLALDAVVFVTAG